VTSVASRQAVGVGHEGQANRYGADTQPFAKHQMLRQGASDGQQIEDQQQQQRAERGGAGDGGRQRLAGIASAAAQEQKNGDQRC
jgi:hypothetical protein